MKYLVFTLSLFLPVFVLAAEPMKIFHGRGVFGTNDGRAEPEKARLCTSDELEGTLARALEDGLKQCRDAGLNCAAESPRVIENAIVRSSDCDRELVEGVCSSVVVVQGSKTLDLRQPRQRGEEFLGSKDKLLRKDGYCNFDLRDKLVQLAEKQALSACAKKVGLENCAVFSTGWEDSYSSERGGILCRGQATVHAYR